MIGYNYSIVAVPAEDESLIIDVYYFQKDNEKLNCVRIDNIYTSFYIHRIPGWTIEQTLTFVQKTAHNVKNNDFDYEIRSDLRDSCYNVLDKVTIRNATTASEECGPTCYVEVFSRYPGKLRELLLQLQKELELYYKNMNYKRLSPIDQMILKNTETPFRNTAHTTQITQAAYWFSRTFDIPFVGFNKIHTEKLKEYRGEYLKPVKINNVYYMSANDGENHSNSKVKEIFEKWEVPLDYAATETNNITIASYDIETYNKNEKPDYDKPKGQYIFCIGVGFFKLNSNKPFERFSIISKDLAADEKVADKLEVIDNWNRLRVNYKNIKVYRITGEYSKDDFTTYLCVRSENEVVSMFVDLLTFFSPHIITGFNNFTFDDPWIFSRIVNKGEIKRIKLLQVDQREFRKDYNAILNRRIDNKSDILTRYLQVFSTYDVSEIYARNIYMLLPQWTRFSMKMEGKTNSDDLFTIHAPVIQTMDVMKLLMKAEAKRFSQKWNLNYMLSSFHIKNPFNGEPLSKTGLTIAEMFDAWDESRDLYDIAFYCLQDSWICGTLIIERSNIVDKLAMSTITFTSFQDSIFRADGHRVTCLNARYARAYNFAFMDEGYSKRVEMIDHNWEKDEDAKIVGLGNKTFDDRIVVGGAVRNVHSRRCTGIVAADFSSMYPSQYRSGNIASSTCVDKYILDNPEQFGLKTVLIKDVIDMYGKRKIYYLKFIE